MKLSVKRYSDNGESTLGLLFVNNKFECYTLEDPYRPIKVVEQTRIPEGTYKIELQTSGKLHSEYSSLKKIKEFHKGMLHICDIPNFEGVMIHIGNSSKDTAGCLLVGNSANNNQLIDGWISESTNAYILLYRKVLAAIDKNEEITITYEDMDKNWIYK